MPDDTGWRDHGIALEVIGDVEQSAHECLVARDSLCHPGLPVACRHLFDYEPSFRTNRYDDGVLDHLCLYQTQHFGPKVLGPVRPAYASPGDFAAAKMNGLHPRGADKNFKHRPGFWHSQNCV